MLKVVLYTSAAKIEQINLDEMIDKARKKNKEIDVTGFLVCHINGFIQLLEGKEKDVDALVEEIRSDSRHHDFTIQEQFYCAERRFANWDMGLMKVSDAQNFNQAVNGQSLVDTFSSAVKETLLEMEAQR